MVLSLGCTIHSCRCLLVLVGLVTFIACVQGDCGRPPEIANTEPVTDTSFPVGSTVVYECDRNSNYYEIPNMIKTITCQDDSTWTQISEFCERACHPPPRIIYAELPQDVIDMNIFRTGTVVKYLCRTGYRRVPSTSSSITCLDDFTWSPHAEFCQRKSCPYPGDAENGELVYTDFLFGSRVTYKCNEGYRMATKRDYRDCLSSGTWSNEVPICEAQLCPIPDSISDGTFDPQKDQYQYSDAIIYSCRRNLYAVGETSLFCTANGTWSSPAPKCLSVLCEDPIVPNSIKLSGFIGPYHLNSAVTFKCNEGLIMNGSSGVACDVNSQWDPVLPECLDGCYAPPVNNFEELKPEYSTRTIFLANEKVEYSCRAGYKIKSSNIRTCQGKLKWHEQHKLLCDEISCPPPEDISKGKPQGDSFTFGSKVTYICLKGYQMTSKINHRTCQANGTWSSELPVCEAMQCPSFDSISNGSHVPQKGKYVYEDVVQFSCNTEKFLFIGKKTISCQFDGTWDSSIPQCREFLCSLPQELHFAGQPVISVEHVNYFKVTFQCAKDYKLKGASEVKCNFKGHWESDPPTCEKVSNHIVKVIVGVVVAVITAILLILIGTILWKKKHSGKPEPDPYHAQYKACEA